MVLHDLIIFELIYSFIYKYFYYSLPLDDLILLNQNFHLFTNTFIHIPGVYDFGIMNMRK